MNRSTAGNSVQFVDQDVAASTGASLVRPTDSSPIPDREVTHTADHMPAGLQMNRLYRHHIRGTCGCFSHADFRNRTLVPGGMDRRSFSGVSDRLGIVSDSHVQLSLSDTGPC